MKEHLTIPSNDGRTRLHLVLWTPDEGPACAVLQLVHGMAEYIDRYHDFAVFMTHHGFAVIGHDHLGHGQSVLSEDRLGFFSEKDGSVTVIRDMHSVTEEGKKRFPGLPFFILGHSMGSFMVRRYITQYSGDITGAVIMGTGFIPLPLALTGLTMSKLTAFLKGDMYRSPLLTFLSLGSNNKPFAPNRTDCDWLSRNEENVDRYIKDPLCGFRFTASAYRDFFTVILSLAKKDGFGQIRHDLPVLVISGEKDPVGGAKACPDVVKSLTGAGLTDVSLKLYPDDRHEILNETDRENVFQDLLDWTMKYI